MGGMPDGHDGERMLFILNAPADGDTKTFTTKETGNASTRHWTTAVDLGLDDGPERDGLRSDHTGPVPPAVSRDRGSALRPGLARMDSLVPEAGGADADPGPVSGGRQRPSGSGRADGDAFRHAGGGEPGRGPRFDAAVPPGGYLWWYVDGLSDCGRYGLSVIAFVGSVFSPYYHWAGRRDPDDHVCINVALYRPGGNRWSMTERGRGRCGATPAPFMSDRVRSAGKGLTSSSISTRSPFRVRRPNSCPGASRERSGSRPMR
jgi:hypothetical protein